MLLLALGVWAAGEAAAAPQGAAPTKGATAMEEPTRTGAAASERAASDTLQVEELEVAVLRTVVPLFAAPMAVSALGERDLDARPGGVFIEEALRGLPGVQVQNRFNPAVGERVAIRGFGARAQFGMRGVRVVVDGIPATLPDGQSSLDHLDLGTLGRVEAVRGPASALFGNASGGVLAFHTRPPATAPFRGELEQVVGSHGLSRTQMTASGTVEQTGYLVSVSRIGWDGFRTLVDEPDETYGASERLALNARLLRPLGGGELSLVLNAMDLDAENPGSVPEDLRDDPDRPVVPLYLTHVTGKELRQAQGGLRWTGPLSSFDADLSLFGIRRTVVNPIPFNLIDLSRSAGGARAQLARTESAGTGELRWLAGVELELQDDDRVELGRNFQGELSATPHTDQAERVQAAGAFLQGNLDLPGGAEALAGLRYDRHEFRADDRIERDPDDFSATGRRTMDAMSPSLGLRVPLGGSTAAFGSLGTVFETPSTTELKNRPDGAGGFNPELEPQRGTAAELGVRRRVGERAALEITAYRTNLRNELIPFEVPEVEGQVFFRNVGTSRHTGLEATVSTVSAGGLARIDATYSRTDARFRSYQLDGEELGGNRVPGVAPHRAQAELRLGPPERWFAAVSTSYVGSLHMDDRNTATAPSYALVDLRAGLRRFPVGQLELAPWAAVKNVLDRGYVASAAVNAAGGRFYEPGPGRTFELGVGAAF